MTPRSAAWLQGSLSACAFLAAVTFGAPWLGLDWVYEITVAGHAFTLGPDFPLALLAAVMMGLAAGLAREHAAGPGAKGLTLAGATILVSSLAILLVWAPGGGSDGQWALLQDAIRLGFAAMALSLSFALPAPAPPLARWGTLAVGIALGPVLLFPADVAQAGLADVSTSWPLLLFFLQGLLAFVGAQDSPGGSPAKGHSGHGWGRNWGRKKGTSGASTKTSAREPEVQILRALFPGRAWGGAHRPRLRHESLRSAFPDPPPGPHHPRPPGFDGRDARAAWFRKF